MNELDSRIVEGRRGAREASGVPDVAPWSFQVLFLCPLVPGRAAALTTFKQRCVFCFLVFLPGECSAGADHQGAGCAHCSMELLEQGRDTQGSF